MTNEGEVYQPGEVVPASGIYDVFHDRLDGHEHAHPHQVTAIRGNHFPQCRACLAGVRFRLHRQADDVESHDFFRR